MPGILFEPDGPNNRAHSAWNFQGTGPLRNPHDQPASHSSFQQLVQP